MRWRVRPRWLLVLTGVVTLLAGAAAPGRAQQPAPPQGPPVDSVVVEGNRRVSVEQILQSSGIILHEPINYRGIQRAITALFRTGQFDDVQIQQRGDESRLVVAILVKERPILARWAVRGAEQVSDGAIRGKVVLVEGRPLDRAAVERARAAIDSLYQKKGFYAARVRVNEIESTAGAVRLGTRAQELPVLE